MSTVGCDAKYAATYARDPGARMSSLFKYANDVNVDPREPQIYRICLPAIFGHVESHTGFERLHKPRSGVF